MSPPGLQASMRKCWCLASIIHRWCKSGSMPGEAHDNWQMAVKQLHCILQISSKPCTLSIQIWSSHTVSNGTLWADHSNTMFIVPFYCLQFVHRSLHVSHSLLLQTYPLSSACNFLAYVVHKQHLFEFHLILSWKLRDKFNTIYAQHSSLYLSTVSLTCISAFTFEREAVPRKAKTMCWRFQASRHFVSKLFSQNISYWSSLGCKRLHASSIVILAVSVCMPKIEVQCKASNLTIICQLQASILLVPNLDPMTWPFDDQLQKSSDPMDSWG